MPHKAGENCPPVLYGLVIELGSYTSAYGDGESVPTARLLTADNVEWSVIAFHGWLAAEFDRKQPRVGDFVAIVYQGEGEAKPGESAPHRYRVIVERNPANPMLAAAPPADVEAATDERPDFGTDHDISFS